MALRGLAQGGAKRIAVEDPSLDRQHDQIIGLGLELVGQPVDHDGLIVDGLDGDAVIVSPRTSSPSARCYPARDGGSCSTGAGTRAGS